MRSRSLRSIVFKLSNGLLSYSELAEEREFLAGLLEWFNQNDWTMESHVLTPLHQLAKVSTLRLLATHSSLRGDLIALGDSKFTKGINHLKSPI